MMTPTESCATCRFSRSRHASITDSGTFTTCHVRSMPNSEWPGVRVDDWCGEYQAVPTPPPGPSCAKCGDSGIVRDASGTVGTNCDHASPTDEQVRELRIQLADQLAPTQVVADTIRCLNALLAERTQRAKPVDDAAVVEEAVAAAYKASPENHSEWCHYYQGYVAAARKYAGRK